jgi:hypothetical protein
VENLIYWLKDTPKPPSKSGAKKSNPNDWSGYLEPGRDHFPETPYGE